MALEICAGSFWDPTGIHIAFPEHLLWFCYSFRMCGLSFSTCSLSVPKSVIVTWFCSAKGCLYVARNLPGVVLASNRHPYSISLAFAVLLLLVSHTWPIFPELSNICSKNVLYLARIAQQGGVYMSLEICAGSFWDI